MQPAEYGRYDGLGLAELVRRGEVGAAELAAAALRAIAALNPAVNAVIEALPDWQRQVAGAAPGGPFAGVPFLIKDLTLQAEGVRCDSGSRLIAGAVTATHDSDLMRRFRRSGLVLLGRTATPEFGYNATTESVLQGPTRNPWALDRSAGGSSGGSAAAVAAGMVPIAHATDGAGSIRGPASACGLVGLKPTRGRVPPGPDYAELLHGLAVEFVVTRSVRDAAAVLDAVEGPGVGDRFEIPRPEHPFLAATVAATAAASAPPRPLRIAFSADAGLLARVDPECAAALEQVAARCAALGHRVEEAKLRYDEAAFHEANFVYWATKTAFRVDAAARTVGRTPSPDNLEASVWATYQHGRRLSAFDFEAAGVRANRVCRAVGGFFATYDVLLTPTLATPPLPLRELNANDPGVDAEGWYRRLLGALPFTALFNMTGQPAISLPLAASSGGLPIGIQAVARYGDESTLFHLAAQLEQAMPWRERIPPVHASRIPASDTPMESRR